MSIIKRRCRKRMGLWLVGLGLLSAASGQKVSWLPGDQVQSIGKQLMVLEDSNRELTITDICSAKVQRRFLSSNQTILHFGFTDKVIWLRFEISQRSLPLLLTLEQAFVCDATLYYQNGRQQWITQKSGYQIPLSSKPVIDHWQAFAIDTSTRVCYLRCTPLIHAIPVTLRTPVNWQLHAVRQKMTYGIYAGILLFAVIINLFLFFALKKTYFLNYAILVFFYLLTSAFVMEGYAVYFFPSTDLIFWYKMVPVLDMPAFLFYCITFFELRKKHRSLFRVTFFSALFFGAYLCVLPYLPLLSVLLLNQLFALYVFVLGTYIGITVGKQGDKLGYLFALSYAVWFLLILVEAVYIQTGHPAHFSSVSYVSMAIFIEAFLLAFLQAKRFQWEKKEDHLRQFEMKNRMETMQQDFRQEMLHTKLEIQEQTFNTISQEIHDNVGQQLSLAKIQMNIMDTRTEKDGQTLTELRDTLSQAMTDLRNIAKNLSSQYILNNTLPETIANQTQQINRLGLVHISFTVSGNERKIEHQKKLVLYRIIQESIQNIIKHAKASQVQIILDYSQATLHVSIIDDGQGFDKTTIIQQGEGLGLQNITSRAELIGGKATIESVPTKGTIIQIITPYE